MSEAPSASTPPSAAAQTTSRERQAVDALLQRPAVKSSGQVSLADGRVIRYGTCCEFLPVPKGGFGDASGDPDAAVFTVAYQQEGVSAAERPVCFAFNGGPGSASVWLHLGALGPYRVVVPDDGTMPAGPYAAVPNPLTWLAHTDLVFIDPPHTGWSKAAGDEARKRVLSVDGDVAALTEVIRGWLTRHRRWGSKVLLAGESYGTTRGAAMAESLQGINVALSGLILVSCAMDLQSVFFSARNDLPYATFLPAMANVAQFQGRLKGAVGASSAAARAAAEAFVQDDYLAALHAGARLSDRQRTRIARRVAELTGLAPRLVEDMNLRVSDRAFFVELLRDQGLQIGRLDARSTGPMGASRGRTMEFDPGIDAIAAPYAMAALAYFRDALGLEETARYEMLSVETHQAWKWTRGDSRGNGYCSTSDDLSRALRRHPHLQVLVASGRYDLGTPYSATDWSLAQFDVPPSVMQRVQHRYYDAGHMFYTRQADLAQFAADLSQWLGSTGAGASATGTAAA